MQRRKSLLLFILKKYFSFYFETHLITLIYYSIILSPLKRINVLKIFLQTLLLSQILWRLSNSVTTFYFNPNIFIITILCTFFICWVYLLDLLKNDFVIIVWGLLLLGWIRISIIYEAGMFPMEVFFKLINYKIILHQIQLSS